METWNRKLEDRYGKIKRSETKLPAKHLTSGRQFNSAWEIYGE